MYTPWGTYEYPHFTEKALKPIAGKSHQGGASHMGQRALNYHTTKISKIYVPYPKGQACRDGVKADPEGR